MFLQAETRMYIFVPSQAAFMWDGISALDIAKEKEKERGEAG